MATSLVNSLGAVEYDNLINSNEPPADVFSITVRKATGAETTYKRGTVMALSSGSAGDSTWVPLGTTAASNETLTANCILADDITVGTAANAVAIAYRTGHFNRNALIFTGEYDAITLADEQALRDAGILLSDAIEYYPAYEEEGDE